MRMIGNAARQKMVSAMRAQDVATLVQPAYDRAMQVFSSRIEGRSRLNPTAARRGLDAGELRFQLLKVYLVGGGNLFP